MHFIDLAAQQHKIRDSLEVQIRSVLDHGQYIMGPEVRKLEGILAEYTGTKHAIGCASGTDALLMALMAYEIGPGDAVFTTPFTFMATAEVISLLGAVPVFVDIDQTTFNLDPAHLERAIEAVESCDSSKYPLPAPGTANGKLRPRGIIAVDLFGLPAEYEGINAIAKKHGLFVIQDAAQSFGAVHAGKKACSMGHVGCTSFFPAKPLGCYGDGGMCFTDDDDCADRMRSVRVHGQGTDKYENVRIGINGRLDTLQAAVLLAKFAIFPEELTLRQTVAQRYTRLLTSDASPVLCPAVPDDFTSAWAQYSVIAKRNGGRSALQAGLKEANVPTAIYYPKPLHLQKAFAYLGYRQGEFPVSEDCASNIFSLPMHPYLGEEDQQKIASLILGLKF